MFSKKRGLRIGKLAEEAATRDARACFPTDRGGRLRPRRRSGTPSHFWNGSATSTENGAV